MGVMKVAFVSECYRPTRNGVVSSIETFRTHLTDLGCHVKIFAPAYPGYYDGQPDVHRFPSICFSSYTEYPIALPWAVAPWRQLNDFAPDIVHTHSVFWLTRMAGYWARHHHVPLVLTFHTLVTEYLHYVPLPRTLARWIVIRLIAQYSNWCDIVLVPTPAVIPILRNYGITADIEPLPTGIEVEQFQVGDGMSIRRQFGIPDTAQLMLYVGRIGLEKNIDFLLDATSLVLQRHRNAYLLLVGPGPYLRQAMHRATKLPGGERIIFAGGYPKERMRDFYAAADVFVFASCTETQGLALAEAMAGGLPCVAIAAHGVAWVLEDNVHGFLVPQVRELFAQRVSLLIERPELRKRMGERARQHIERHFSASHMAKRLFDIYEHIISNRRNMSRCG